MNNETLNEELVKKLIKTQPDIYAILRGEVKSKKSPEEEKKEILKIFLKNQPDIYAIMMGEVENERKIEMKKMQNKE